MKTAPVEKRKVGRPRNAVPYELISFTLNQEIYDELSRVAKAERVSRSVVVARCVRRYFGDDEEELQIESLQKKLDRIAAILDEEER